MLAGWSFVTSLCNVNCKSQASLLISPALLISSYYHYFVFLSIKMMLKLHRLIEKAKIREFLKQSVSVLLIFIPKLLANLCTRQRFSSQNYSNESTGILISTSITSGAIPWGRFCGAGNLIISPPTQSLAPSTPWLLSLPCSSQGSLPHALPRTAISTPVSCGLDHSWLWQMEIVLIS